MDVYVLAVAISIAAIVENFLASVTLRLWTSRKALRYFIFEVIAVVICIKVLYAIVENMQTREILLYIYAVMYSLGGVIEIKFDKYLERLAKSEHIKLLKRRFFKKRAKRRGK